MPVKNNNVPVKCDPNCSLTLKGIGYAFHRTFHDTNQTLHKCPIEKSQ